MRLALDGTGLSYGPKDEDDADPTDPDQAEGLAVEGSSNSDWLASEDGDDLLQGGAGNDDLLGDLDDDTLREDDGTDWIYGDGGDDLQAGGWTIWTRARATIC